MIVDSCVSCFLMSWLFILKGINLPKSLFQKTKIIVLVQIPNDFLILSQTTLVVSNRYNKLEQSAIQIVSMSMYESLVKWQSPC